MHIEKINYDNPLLSLNINYYSRVSKEIEPWHYHEDLEILVITEGRLDVYIENELTELSVGDIFIIGPSQLHTDRSHSNLSFFVFQCDIKQFLDQSTLPYERFFTDTNLPLSHLNAIYRQNPTARNLIADTVKEIYEEWISKSEGYEIAIGMLIRRIMLILLRNNPHRVLKLSFNPNFTRLKPVFHYVEQNLGGKITVEEASKTVNMSYFHFAKMFRRVMCVSFINYVNQLKIKNAEKILLTKDLSVAEVGELIGIPNTVHFHRMFRKFNDCSPHEYRKKMHQWPLDNKL
ncbi:MAG TPA: AraC family transcriptional regulator [Bacilli bacterium]